MTDTPEEMKAFFDARVEGYDEHMFSSIEDYASFYRKVAEPLPYTNEHIEVLDLGAGTGIELEFIFAKAPNVRITVVDLSETMLNKLVKKYEVHRSQIRIIVDSFLTLKVKPHSFDFVVSVMSLHHLVPTQKTTLYRKLRRTLVLAGAYVEGDYVVSVEEESRLLKEYQALKKEFSLLDEGLYHIDIPFSEETQIRALNDAGFDKVQVLFRTFRSNVVVAKPESA
ncbi:class I SAM-dependent methyltransferase [Candidatus Bathyarchaeota archaeon]|nr:MAG: class I SAM-dependent methyltransferase [Candidatus Bathyarchaeota archaeon]